MQKAKKIAIIGLDSSIAHLAQKHIDEGILPNMKKIFDQGAWAKNCYCAYPTITPPNWTSMATGAWPGTTGITDFWRHVPGTSPIGANTHNAFNWDFAQAESIWEVADAMGKKSVVLNWPSSYNVHKKLKHGVVVGGASVVPLTFTDQSVGCELRNEPYNGNAPNYMTFCDDILFSTEVYPGNNVRIRFDTARGWENVDDMGDEALDCVCSFEFTGSVYHSPDPAPATWHILLRDLDGNGYDTVTLSPTKNFRDAFFTIKGINNWSDAFNFNAPMADGSTVPVRSRAKFLSVDDEGGSFRLYLCLPANLDGKNWCYPPEVANKLNKGNNAVTGGGTVYLGFGWFGFDTWLEIVRNHYEWLGDTAEALLGDGDWSVFTSHAHPTDFMYHLIMTDMDENTCSSPEAYDQAWHVHREVWKAADAYVERLLKLMGDDTIFVVAGDHGATPDGPNIDMVAVLEQAKLCVQKPFELPEWAKGCPDNVKETFKNLAAEFDLPSTKAIPQRMCYVYVNLKGRDPGGCVEPENYAKVQREIIDALMTYVDPRTGKRPFMLALPKEEAGLLGLWGDQCGDVVYALWPEFSMQHGPILPSSSYGIGTLRPLCLYYGPNVKKGVTIDRHCSLVDLVPTLCYGAGWPVPKHCEGAVVYQIFEEQNQ